MWRDRLSTVKCSRNLPYTQFARTQKVISIIRPHSRQEQRWRLVTVYLIVGMNYNVSMYLIAHELLPVYRIEVQDPCFGGAVQKNFSLIIFAVPLACGHRRSEQLLQGARIESSTGRHLAQTCELAL